MCNEENADNIGSTSIDSELPAAWARTLLGDIVRWSSGRFLPKERQRKGSYPVYGGNGVTGQHDVFLIDQPTLVVGRVGALCGNVYATLGPSWVTDNAIFAISMAPGLDLRYLLFFLRHSGLNQLAGGSGQPFLNQKILNSVMVPVAPLLEQRRIAAKLEILLASVNTCQQRLDKMPKLLARFRQSVLAAACSGRLTSDWRRINESPDSADWDIRALGDVIAGIDAGRSFTCEERPPGGSEFGVLKISAVTWDRFDEMESKTCHDPLKWEPAFRVRKGDFLISRANTQELVGACVIVRDVNKRLMLSDKTLRIRFAGLNPAWALYWLRSSLGRSQIEESATGNQQSMRNISQKALRSIQIAVPPADEQCEIVRRVEELYALANSLEVRVAAARKRVEALTQSVLAKAFRGELVPTEAELAAAEGHEYETASMLLERVKSAANHRSGSDGAESTIRKVRSVRASPSASKGKR